MTKHTELPPLTTNRPSKQTTDNWITGQHPTHKEPLKRLTLDIPATLHTTIKTHCAQNGTTMINDITTLLTTHYQKPTPKTETQK